MGIAEIGTAQEETLLGKTTANGGFGAPVIKVTTVNNTGTMLTGIRGGWILDHSFIIGAGSYNLVNEFDAGVQSYQMNYSGLELEYIFRPMALFHYSVYLLAGGGEIRQKKPGNWTPALAGADGIVVLVPAVHVLMNVSEYFHAGAGIGYRWMGDVETANLRNSDISGLEASLTLNFGKF